MQTKMNIHEIVMKLVGPVHPIGDHGIDQVRLANMKALTELVDRLLFEIDAITPNADRAEASMKAVGVHARDFMGRVKDA